MTVSDLAAQRLAPNTWRLSWSSDLGAPLFYVYRDGILVVGPITPTYLVVRVPDGESPVFDVIDQDGVAPDAAYPGRVTVAWWGVDGADHYVVREYVGAAWVDRKTFWPTQADYYKWLSARLADSTLHTFRVVAVGADGNESTAAEREVYMVRHPDEPAVTFTYDDQTGNVTVAEA